MVRQISARCTGREIAAIEVLRGPFLRGPRPVGWTIVGVRRRGKCPIFVLQDHNGDRALLVSRLGMSGYWDFADDPWTFDYVEGSRESVERDVRVRITFRTGEVLRYHDARRFGRLELGNVPEMGPDVIGTMWSYPDHPSSDAMDWRYFRDHVVHNHWLFDRPIKAALLEQRFIAGVGNIYANEACHLAEVDPATTAGRLDPTACQMLWRALRCVLSLNLGEISYGWLRVYRRHACGSCGAAVRRTELKGRATFHCPICQRNP